MNLNEVKQLLTEVAAIDNRKLNDQTAEAWHAVLGFMPLDIAKEALHLARKDDRINWMEPKNIVSWAKEAAFKLDRAKPVVTEQIKGSQQPRCKAHSALLLTCIPCCKQLHQQEGVQVTESILELQ
jgi:hypothetical protein|tara:strand:+ start:541 stop:918 length:378 start_codon:yes stop_codon:yes gene_type:complete